jgi:hypothetical protein
MALAPAEALLAEFEASHQEFFPKMLQSLDAVHEPSLEVLADTFDHSALSDSRESPETWNVSAWQPAGKVFMTERYAPYEIGFPIDWTLDPYSDKTWQHGFNSLRWIWPHLEASDLESLRTGLKVVDDWLTQNSHWPRTNSRYQWGDHTSAIRLETLIRAWRAYLQTSLRDDAFRDRLLAGIASHVYLLASDAVYYEWDNHAIIVDLALLEQVPRIVGMSSDVRDRVFAWAEQRIVEQLKYAFLDDGSHREHSACYHVFVTNMLLDAVTQIEAAGEPVPGELQALVHRTSSFLAHSLTPSGSLPGIGDCNDAVPPLRETYIQENPQLQYSVTAGAAGARPNSTFGLFPTGGWVAMRSSWDTVPLATSHLLAQSDYFSTTHYHEDDTSFVFGAFGQPLIVDPGFHSYNQSSLDLYSRSAAGHNLLLVDNQSFSVTPEDVGRSGITRWLTLEAGSWRSAVELTHPHYEKVGVAVHRVIVQLEGHVFSIEDETTGGQGLGARQLFHLAPGAKLTNLRDGTLRVDWPTHTASLWLKSSALERVDVSGEMDPTQGWYFADELQPVPSVTLQFAHELHADQARVRTWIAATRDKEAPNWDAAEAASEAATVCLRAQPRRILESHPPPGALTATQPPN